MTDQDHDSPGKFGVGFRFRAGEDDLEELSLPDTESDPQFESLQRILQLPRKLLNKDHSLSDSEDTSESSKLSEWWKDAEEGRVAKSDSLLSIVDPDESGVKRRAATVNVLNDIKVARGRIDANPELSEVEAGEEAGEGGPSRTPIGSVGSPTPPPPPPTPTTPTEDLPPSAQILNTMRGSLGTFLGWCVPLVAVSWVPVSTFWNGAVYGACIYGLVQSLWRLMLTVVGNPTPDIPQGKFQAPNYKALPPLRTQVVPAQKRGCFNVYNKPYDPDTYSVSLTKPVCLELDGPLLKLTKVKTKLGKRAHFSQPDFEVDPTKEVIYDLSRCSVVLMPHGLTRKRLYSKKYPITVVLGEGAVVKGSRPGEEPYHTGWEANQRTSVESDDYRESEESERSEYLSPLSPALYLFARCDRDKEDWYRRLLAASTPLEDAKETPDMIETSSVNSEENGEEKREPLPSSLDQYLLCMSKFVEMPHKLQNSNLTPGEAELEMEVDSIETQWFNAVVNRILFDVFRSPYWIQKIQDKLQKKLSSLRLPYYVEEMQITELDLGRSGPVVHRISQPILDERGIWFDLDLTHEETMKVTIQTKLNLHKLQKGKEEENEEPVPTEKTKSPLFDSEAEDSAESSSEDESRPSSPPPVHDPETPVKAKRKPGGFLRMVENVAQSRAFRHVAQTKVVQKVIAGVSQTKLRLQVEVKGIVGTVAVNFPPPPSDRVWYGFRGMPKIWLKATPLLGDWNVSHVKNWIEKKLIQEFQMLLVLPNMHYVLIPWGRPPHPSPGNLSPRTDSQEPFDSPLDLSYYPDLNSLLQAGYDVESLRANLNEAFDRKPTNRSPSKSAKYVQKGSGGSSKSTKKLTKESRVFSKSTRDLPKASGGSKESATEKSSSKSSKDLRKISLTVEDLAVFYRRRGSSVIAETEAEPVAGPSKEQPSNSKKKLSRGQESFSLLPDYSEFEDEEDEGGFLVLFRRKGS